MFLQKIKNLTYSLIFCASFIAPAAVAQNQDSLTIVQAKWNSKTLQKGVVWHQGHFQDLFNSVQEINWVEIDLKKTKARTYLGADPVKLKKTSEFADDLQALVAINGGFFNMKNGGSVDYIKVNKEVINVQSDKSPRANAVLLINKKKVQIQSVNPTNTENSKIPNVMQSGPLLVENGNNIDLTGNPFNDNRHPRTAIAISHKNKLILMVVDGRSNQAYGMSLPELAKVLSWLGAKDAMNLDGGGSSTMYIKGATENNIVNYPSDNKKFDHEGQRSVANIIYIK